MELHRHYGFSDSINRKIHRRRQITVEKKKITIKLWQKYVIYTIIAFAFIGILSIKYKDPHTVTGEFDNLIHFSVYNRDVLFNLEYEITGTLEKGAIYIEVVSGKVSDFDEYTSEDIIKSVVIDELGEINKVIEIGDAGANNVKTVVMYPSEDCVSSGVLFEVSNDTQVYLKILKMIKDLIT